MPHQSLKLIPGVDTNRTPALNEAGISETNLIRFFRDKQGIALPQKLGGWTKYYSSTVGTSINCLHAWADIDVNNHLAVGALSGLYTIEDGVYSNRSPQTYSIVRSPSITTVSGSAVVTIADATSNITSLDYVNIEIPISVNGVVLFGLYPCTANASGSYRVTATDILNNPIYATASSTGGAVPVFTTTSGSSIVTVTLADHRYNIGDTFAALVSTSVGGVTIADHNYIIQDVPSTSTFTIVAPQTATSSTSVSMNSGNAIYTYYIVSNGLPSTVGYGGGGYGGGGYGTGSTVSGGRQFTTTAASAVSTTATVTFAESTVVPIGSTVVVAGVTPTGFNGTWVVTASSAGSISFTTPTALSGPQTVAGTITLTVLGWATENDWTLDNFGENLIATPQGGPVFFWYPDDAANGATIVPNSPTVNRGAFVAMPQRQIIAYGSTFNGISDPLLIRYCDVNNFASWIGRPTNQAGSYRLSSGSVIVGAIQAAQQTYFWTDIGLWAGQYVGPPYVYSFNEIGTGCGLVGKKALTKMGQSVYWMSQSQFWKAVGNGVEQMECSVWDMVFQQIDTDNYDKIRCAANSRFNEVTWYYPTVGSGGIPTSYVKLNVTTGNWDYGSLTRTAWIDQSVLGPPIGAGDDNFIYQHETSNDADGQAMVSSFTTGYFTLADGDMLTFLDQLWPDMKWGQEGGSQNANVMITFYAVEYPGQTPRVFGPFSVTEATTYITPRFRSRLVAIKVESSDVGSFWRLGNIRYRAQPDGKFL